MRRINAAVGKLRLLQMEMSVRLALLGADYCATFSRMLLLQAAAAQLGNWFRICAALVLAGVLAACINQTIVEPPPTRTWSSTALADLHAAAEAAPVHGLPAEADWIRDIDRLDAASLRDARAAAALDAAADALFRRLASAYAIGAVDPATADPDWAILRPAPPDVSALLSAAREQGGAKAMLESLLPATGDYVALERELAIVQAEGPGAVDTRGLKREERLDRLRVNLERERWLPRTLPVQRMEVLIPFFEARLRDGAVISESHRVIVGARRTPTPTFEARIQSITLNPSWSPPSSIILNELAPRFRRDPSLASSEGFDVLDAGGNSVDPAAVNWRARPFPYTMRQRPGPGNALGRLRFDMPNAYSIFMHDTPARTLFRREDRALSHGCIRVEEPVPLARAVLGSAEWGPEALHSAIDRGETQAIRLPQALPVFVLYRTARVDADGAIQYAEDIYGRDWALLRRLDENRPLPTVGLASGESECAG